MLELMESKYSKFKIVQRVGFLSTSKSEKLQFQRVPAGPSTPTLWEELIPLAFNFREIRRNERMPDLVGRGWNGHDFSLEKLRGKPVLLVFGTARSLPYETLRQLQMRYVEQQLQIVTVLVSAKDLDEVREKQQQGVVTWRHVIDGSKLQKSLAYWLAGNDNSNIYLIDSRGLLKKRLLSESPIGELVEELISAPTGSSER